MKLTYKKYPVLSLLKGNNVNITFPEKNTIEVASLTKVFLNKNKEFFLNDINYITIPFYESMKLAEKKISSLIVSDPTCLDSSKPYVRCVLLEKGVLFYNFFSNEKEGNSSIEILYFENNQLMFFLRDSKNENIFFSDDELKNIGFSVKDKYITNVLFLELFLKYAEVQNKLLKPNKKIGDFKCRYKNEMPFNVNVLDSTWFTNLVKSDSFKVRGHFRLQPYSNGVKKLIWIEEYKKSGYRRLNKKQNL